MIVPTVEFEHRSGEIIFGGNMLNLALGMRGLSYVWNTPVRYVQHRGPHMSLSPREYVCTGDSNGNPRPVCGRKN